MVISIIGWLSCFVYLLHQINVLKINISLNPSFTKTIQASSLPSHYPSDVVNLTSTLISIPSETGNEQSVIQYVENWFKFHNFTVLSQSLPPSITRRNILAIPSTTFTQPSISDIQVLLSTHLDTVPGNTTSYIEHGRLYGRGSVDAKGLAASMMISLLPSNHHHHHHQSKSSMATAILLVCGEEKDHIGMSSAHELGFRNDLILINGEPTDNKFVTLQKGIIRATLKVYGISGHSGYPFIGRSAIHKLINILTHIQNETSDGEDIHATETGITMNVGKIQGGGSAANIIADYAQADLLWRVPGNVQHVIEKTKNIIDQYNHNDDVEFVIEKYNHGLELNVPSKMSLELGTKTVAYNTDLPYFQGKTSKSILFGTGSIHQAHTDKEFIDIQNLLELPNLYAKIVTELIEENSDEHNGNDQASGNNNDKVDHDEI